MRNDEELAVLFPDREVTVRDPNTGEDVSLTVREFRFREGLEATALARPLIAALAELVPDPADPEGPDALAIEGALAAHAALWLELVARASDRDAAWLARLSDADGRALSEAMWAANGGFFFAPRGGSGGGADARTEGEPVALHRVLDTLIRAGHGRGHLDLSERLTWRQIALFFRAATE